MCLYFILYWALEELRNLRFFRGSKLGVSLRIRRLPVQFPLSKFLEVVKSQHFTNLWFLFMCGLSWYDNTLSIIFLNLIQESIDAEVLCTICYALPQTVTFVPCGHSSCKYVPLFHDFIYDHFSSLAMKLKDFLMICFSLRKVIRSKNTKFIKNHYLNHCFVEPLCIILMQIMKFKMN